MKPLLDFFPLLLFFVAYKFFDVYAATLVAIAATAVQVAVQRARNGHIEAMPLVSLAIIVVFGGLTIALHDDTFIKLKPTIIDWLLACVLVFSQFFGRRTALEYAMGSQLRLPASIWRRVNLGWALFFLVAGALNIYVAFYFGRDLDAATRTDIWVDFKVFGLLGLTVLFAIAQSVFIARHIAPETIEEGN
jgi:intracellular septation protein